jgi:sialate O-acetylesterase
LELKNTQNMKSYYFKITFFFIGCLLLSLPLSARLTLPVLFTDNMVLQQKAEAPVWGTTKANQKVQVKTGWDNKTYETVADKSGNWSLKVQTPEAGGAYQLVIKADETKILNNVMIGEVWICSGQSNMEMPLAGWGKIANYEQEIANANHSNIRLFQVEKATALSPVKSLKVMGGSWQVCSPQSVPEFSASAYFFAVNLSKMLNNIPIGLIHTSWGGTPAEAWTSAASLGQMPDFADYLNELKKIPTDPVEQQKFIDNEESQWKARLISNDKGYSNGTPAWNKPEVDDSAWKTMFVPKAWEEQSLKDFDGIVWFRKQVELPASFAGKDLTLSLGTIDDNETTYFNGQPIGTTQGWDQNRIYTIAAKLVKAGKNIIAVRVTDTGGGGGFYGDPSKVFVACNGEKISLSGDWKYNVGLNLKDVEAPKITANQVQPTTLFNAMIHPLVPYAIRGAIWYQGEANVDRAEQYSRLFPLMIQDWRKQWNSDFPFYFVQLANYLKREEAPAPSPWAELREAQQSALNLANTGMAVTIDIGNGEDIHPKNKQDVGKRLALVAASKTYGVNVVSEGPEFQSYKITGSQVEVTYSGAGSGLQTRNGEQLKGFSIAGPDKKFYWANAEIKGNKVVISAPQVEFPVAVRYNWANNPDGNLYNREGLPAVPFRTDSWKE